MSIRGHTMKKIIIIFLIAFYLLSFTGVSYLDEKPFNFGKFWNSLSTYERDILLTGMSYGMIKCIQDFYDSINYDEKGNKVLPLSISENNNFVIFLTSNCETIRNVMTNLYEDPSNTYIPLHKICYLSHCKLKGESIESSLRELREEALP